MHARVQMNEPGVPESATPELARARKALVEARRRLRLAVEEADRLEATDGHAAALARVDQEQEACRVAQASAALLEENVASRQAGQPVSA